MNVDFVVSEVLARSFLEQHPHAVLVIDPGGKVVHANAAAGWLALDGRFPDFPDMTGLPWPSHADSGNFHTNWSRRLHARAADGSSRFVDANFFPALTAAGESPLFYLDLRDVTASVQFAQAFQAAESRSRVNSDSAPVLTWMAEPGKSRDWFNKPWLKFRGRSLLSELDDGWTEGIHPEDRERRESIFLNSSAHREPFTMDYRLRRHDGVYRWLLDTAIPRFGVNDTFLGYIGSCVDITERKDLENQLAEHTRTLRLTDRRREDFLAKLSHELRNPLAPIADAAAILKMIEGADPRLLPVRQIIERQVEHLRRIVNDLVDVSRITRGKVLLQREIFDIDALIDSAVDLARPQTQSRRQFLRLERSASVLQCDGDLQRLSQALAALLENAATFSPEGSTITISVHAANAVVAIAVQDTGCGVAPELLPHVFDLFVQGEQGLAREIGGLGVGLTIAKRMAELHGGMVDLASNSAGEGTVATLRLPLSKAASAHPFDPVDLTTVAALRVLVIEDKGDARESLRTRLEMSGNEVVVAADAVEALRITEWFVPELVICDLGLPGVDGYALMGALRDKFVGTPFHAVALTGYGRTDDRDLAIESGFDSFQVKPIQAASPRASSLDLKRA